jgi:acylglycerol lipase
MTRPIEENIQGKGGKLFVRSWLPASPRGIVAICHGFNAHSGYYAWVADHLVASGLAVYALDLRGRGKSGGEH